MSSEKYVLSLLNKKSDKIYDNHIDERYFPLITYSPDKLKVSFEGLR